MKTVILLVREFEALFVSPRKEFSVTALLSKDEKLWKRHSRKKGAQIS